jgi:hypothetical protein
VVLDGATRLTAFRALGYPYIIVQVVDIEQQRVQLTSWHHAVYGGSVAGLLDVLQGIEGLRLTPTVSTPLGSEAIAKGVLAHLLTADQRSFAIEASSPSLSAASGQRGGWQENELALLNEMVAAYGRWGNVERTLTTDVAMLQSQFPDLAALFLFPRFTPQMILDLAGRGQTVPAGITRFLIPGRILRLNASLQRLAADEPLASKREWLDGLIREKLLNRQVRFYEEPVVLLDD